MKILCDCGSKYAFDASPEMVRNPVTFACPECGADLSARINDEVKRQFGNVTGPVALSVSPTATATTPTWVAPATEIAPPPPGAARPGPTPAPPRISVNPTVSHTPISASPEVRISAPVTASAPESAPTAPALVAPAHTPVVRINLPAAAAPAPEPIEAAAPAPIRLPQPVVAPAPRPAPQPVAVATVVPAPPAPSSSAPQVRLSHSAPRAAAAPDVVDTRFCPKHPQQRTTEKCVVCGKGICPKCMQLFGYVCSPHCKEKADLQGIEIPVYAGQRDVAQNREWGKVVMVTKIAAGFIVVFLGVWFWYAWFGSRPKPSFAVRFEDEPAMSGASAVCPDGQIVFLHGSKLARYDLGSKKEVWLRHLVDKKKIAEKAAAEIKEMQAEAAREGDRRLKIPDVQELTKDLTQSEEESLQLEVRGKNIWVTDGEKVTRYDWETGEPKDTVEFEADFTEAIHRGDDLEIRERLEFGRMAITRFNLTSGKISRTEIGDKPKVEVAANSKTNKNTKAVASKTPVKTTPGTKPLDPQKLAAAVGAASTPAKIAAPATISVAVQQQRALKEMEDMDDLDDAGSAFSGFGSAPEVGDEYKRLIPTADGFIQFTTKLLEWKIVEREAMKAAPKKSALEGNVSAGASLEIANELLNEMQRELGGSKVREDQSRYLAKVHVGGKDVPDWEGEFVGKAAVYPQANVNVVVGGKTLVVLDKSNKKKWESTLAHPLSGGGTYFEDDEDALSTGLGPVVERGDTLYVFDQGVLSAFETANGNARWRLPSVGVSGLYFDDKGSIYVNTTTASPDKIKYSKQIDVTDQTGDIVIKLDAKTGKEIWKHAMGGTIAHLNGKYIYTMSYHGPLDDDEELSPEMVAMGVQTKPYLRIRRINPKNGRVMWDYYQPRGPLDVKIHENTFQVVLKKEVQVLKFLSL